MNPQDVLYSLSAAAFAKQAMDPMMAGDPAAGGPPPGGQPGMEGLPPELQGMSIEQIIQILEMLLADQGQGMGAGGPPGGSPFPPEGPGQDMGIGGPPMEGDAGGPPAKKKGPPSGKKDKPEPKSDPDEKEEDDE